MRKEGIEGGRRGAKEVVRGKEGRRRRDGGREGGGREGRREDREGGRE